MYQSLESCAIYFALAYFHAFASLSIRFHPFLWYVHRYSFIFPHVHEMRRRVPWFIHFHMFPFRLISKNNILCGLFGWHNHGYSQKLSWTKIAGWVKFRRKTRLKWGSLLRYMDIWIAPLFTPVYILHNIRIKSCQPHLFIEEYTAVPPQVLNSIVSLECVPLHSQKWMYVVSFNYSKWGFSQAMRCTTVIKGSILGQD